MHAYKANKFNTQGYAVAVVQLSCLFPDLLRIHETFSLISHRLTFSNILEEIPLRIRTNPLLGAFLTTLTTPGSTPSPSLNPASSSTAALPPTFSTLDLGSASISKNLTQVLESLDDYKTEEGNLAYLQRQIAREKARAESHIQKRREENALRVSQGLPPLPEDDISRLFRIPPEPSRLESTLLLGQIDAYSKSLAEGASVGLVKMYAANAGSSVQNVQN